MAVFIHYLAYYLLQEQSLWPEESDLYDIQIQMTGGAAVHMPLVSAISNINPIESHAALYLAIIR